MAEPVTSVPSTIDTSKARSWLIFGAIGVFVSIVFGLLYLFVLAPNVPNGSVGWFLFSFATGLTMIVMPCTLPLAFVIVPLSMGKGLVKGLGMAVAFGVGIATTLSLYGVAAALLGGIAIDALGADLDSIKNWVYFVAGIFALVFALSEIGLLNFHMPTYSGSAPAFIQKRGEFIKAFLLGLFLGNVGVGCPHPATPLILIEIASSGDVLYGWLMFLVHAIGRILPLLLLAFLAILGVNGLNWLMTRKDAVEKTTGWAMVFVAGFILTLGLFSHDWWVNSGIHSGLEVITQEARFNALINDTLGTDVAHVHGLEVGEGLFGLPLSLGNWFLVSVWIIPIWWWYFRKKKGMELGTAQCDAKLLSVKRNFLIVISIFIVVTFTHFLPKNFYLESISGVGHGDDHGSETEHLHDDSHAHGDNSATAGAHVMSDGTIMGADGNVLLGAHAMPDGTIMMSDGTVISETKSMGGAAMAGEKFSKSTDGLPDAINPETIELKNGDSYNITAYYVKKEIGNRTLRMLSYNGSVPGPFIKVSQGAEIDINFTNNSDIGQTIHSHGVRVDNNFDGVPGLTQNIVAPGESFTYKVKFDDSGVYWYHPHTRDDYGQEMGLYGNYLIEPEAGYSSPVNREIPLVIDDVLIENNQIADFYKEFTNFALLGRFGNEYLINGEKNYTLTVKSGEVVRFFVTNVSNARTYNLSLPGATMKMVGADIGQYEREYFAKSFLLSPAERVIVEAYFDDPGTYQLLHTMPDGDIELVRFVVSDENVETSYEADFNLLNTNKTVVDEFSNFRSYLNSDPEKKLLLTLDVIGNTVDHSAHAHGVVTEGSLGQIQWNDATHGDYVNTTNNIIWKLVDQDSNKVNLSIDDWTFTKGSLVKIRLTNDAAADHVMQHPIHLHGQRFVILSKDGVPNQNFVWKDTVLVLPGETVDILVDMSNLGEWMTHCHISEHLHAGMMMPFRVEDENGYATGDEYRAENPTAKPSNQHMMQANVQMMNMDVNKRIPNNDANFDFNSSFPTSDYRLSVDKTTLQAGKVVQFAFSILDKSGKVVSMSSDWSIPVSVLFVKSDNAEKIKTFPGNTAFDSYAPVDTHITPVHDNSDGHHGLNIINTVYASGGDDHNHDADGTFSYSVPVAFVEKGIYKAFVSFVPQGESDIIVLPLDVEVLSGGYSVDNYGWSKTTKWWILFLGSLILMAPLVWVVRKYVNVEKV